jgi:hypothetical protein
MFRPFGNRAGLLPFAGAIALETLGIFAVLSAALTSRANRVVISFRFLGHSEFLLMELCYALLLAPISEPNKRSATAEKLKTPTKFRAIGAVTLQYLFKKSDAYEEIRFPHRNTAQSYLMSASVTRPLNKSSRGKLYSTTDLPGLAILKYNTPEPSGCCRMIHDESVHVDVAEAPLRHNTASLLYCSNFVTLNLFSIPRSAEILLYLVTLFDNFPSFKLARLGEI